MNKILLSIGVTLVINSFYSQSEKKEWSLGVDVGIHQYFGEVDNQFFKDNSNYLAGLSLSKYINPSWDMLVTGSFSRIESSTATGYFKAQGTDFNLAAKLKMNNNLILKENSFIAPYLYAGIGDYFGNVYRLPGMGSSRIVTPSFFGGAGITFNLSPSLAADIRIKSAYMWSDRIDDNVTETRYNDQLLSGTFGLAYKFTTKKDTDNDGVIDKEDKCPEVFGLAKFNGCPDTDADGIQDSEDKCPLVAGTLNGCPDSDGDGIADMEDKCPTIAGLISFAGCPDTDGDGIQDSEDKCPTIAGTLLGCPDSDKDGFADKEDNCPTIFGLFDGCPDTDGDGLPDDKDKCPTVAGVVANNGCPVQEIKEETKKVFLRAMEGLFFNSGSAVIKTTSYGVLDNVAKIMQEDQSIKVDIEGHTDNTGDAAKNLQLSKDRALAAKNYLIKKGVDASRLTSEGFGVTKPRADNATPAGRTLNRRVEFKPRF